jgi:hypothetical protein
MAKVKVLARKFKLEIDTDSILASPTGTPAFVEIKGLSSMTFDTEKTDADANSFDNEGVDEHIVASRAKSIALQGKYYEDLSDGSRDAGQSAVEDLSELTAERSLGDFKLTTPGGTVKTFSASASVSGIGGGLNDTANWNADLKISGAVTTT